MSNHPLNLALRFMLEIAALVAIGYWGWSQHEGGLRVILGIGLPLIAALIWGAFRDPRDHGKGLVAISGPLRLVIEALFFTTAVVLLALVQPSTALILAVVIMLHYAVSYDRIGRMLRR